MAYGYRRPRRKRYTVYMTDGTAKAILAYDGFGADKFYRDRGYQVERVVKGDHVNVVEKGSGFRIDYGALAEAITMLGLKLPVEIKLSRKTHRTMRGQHTLAFRGGACRIDRGKITNLDSATETYHHIMLKDYLDPEQASRTLWHELTHAMQCERAHDKAGASTPRERYKAWDKVVREDRRNRGVAYENKAVEREARAGEDWADALPLAVPR